VPLGGDLPRLERLAYFPDDVISQLGSSCVVLVGACAPVSYFGYTGQPSSLVRAERRVQLSSPGEDGAGALEQLEERLSGDADHRSAGRPAAVAPPTFPPEHSPTLSPIAIAE